MPKSQLSRKPRDKDPSELALRLPVLEGSSGFRALVFAGAGASRAVSGEKYPTTKEFFERLPATISEAELFKQVRTYLRRNSGASTTLDIEQVLWVLRELDSQARAVKDPEQLFGWLLRENRLAKVLATSGDRHTYFKEAADQLLQRTSNLVGRINECVYDLYATEPTVEELEENWFALLRGLLEIECPSIDIVTTNYDLVLENALSLLRQNGLGVCDLGWAGDVSRRLELEKWTNPDTGRGGASSSSVGLLTKLHGSVNWRRAGTDILISDPLYKGSHEKHAIIYPGFKGRPKEEPFIAFHEYFARALSHADVIIFIGFAFRDEYIEDLCSRWIPSSARVFSVNPDKAALVPFSRKRVTRLQESFSSESVRRLLDLIRG